MGAQRKREDQWVIYNTLCFVVFFFLPINKKGFHKQRQKYFKAALHGISVKNLRKNLCCSLSSSVR